MKTFNPKEFQRHIKQQEKRLNKYMKREAPIIIGTEAKNWYAESFDNEGFTNRVLKRWKRAKRKKSTSKWYGFQYRARSPLPDNHPRRKGAKSKYKARKKRPITNYSPAARKRKTLTGITGDLKESIDYNKKTTKIVVESDLPYAKIHNEGGVIKVFGKKSAKVEKRQFIGDSEKMNEKILKELNNDIDKILNK